MIRFSHQRSIADSLREYGRGIAGGLMFSIPLLYTMEVWWAGVLLHPWRILIFGVATFSILIVYNRFAGLRKDASLAEVAIDSVEEMGIGLLLSAAILWLTGRIGADLGWMENLGQVTIEAMTVAIGVSVGTAQLGTPEDGDEGLAGEEDASPDAFFPQLLLALCGAVLFAANVAPTDEIAVIAAESTPWKLLIIALGSILLGSLIIRFANFRGSDRFVTHDGFKLAARDLVTTYAVSLGASAALLWFFGKLDGEPFFQCLAMTVVLALPAVLGASAGRLLLQNGDSSPSRKKSS
jgi:putative integral membrane protein (TIGR02587 family)